MLVTIIWLLLVNEREGETAKEHDEEGICSGVPLFWKGRGSPGGRFTTQGECRWGASSEGGDEAGGARPVPTAAGHPAGPFHVPGHDAEQRWPGSLLEQGFPSEKPRGEGCAQMHQFQMPAAPGHGCVLIARRASARSSLLVAPSLVLSR